MDDSKLVERLTSFKDDIREAMNAQPVKIDRDGNELSESYSAFSDDQRDGNQFVEGRDTFRSRMQGEIDGTVISLDDILPGRAPIGLNDRPESLVDELVHDTLEGMDSAGLREATLDESPWSDDYWPTYCGVLGKRYADSSFPSSEDWQENLDYVQNNPASTILASGDTEAADQLSPSEKYDLLIGDPAGTLTRQMWEEGRRYYDNYGSVETWMGICHGWAPAAYMLQRPRTAVRVPDYTGTREITFYPADIKALASLLWAKDAPRIRFSGGRCNDKDAELDPDTGRVLSPACFDTNLATWHMAVVNQLGVSRRSIIIDATFDYEVWNQPMYKYSYRYFNPLFLASVDTLEEAKVSYSSFHNRDYFKQFRKRDDIESVVGIAMRASYVVETEPTQREYDDAEHDAIVSVWYLYDLELDADGRLVGGEWYQNKHPDFLWTPSPEAKAVTGADEFAEGDWWPGNTVPDSWREAALRSSAQGVPLAKIVEALVENSNA